MVNETQGSATRLVFRGKELFGNGQYALAGVCYQHAKCIYDEAHDSPNSLQMELNLEECLALARQHGQDYEPVKELSAEVLLDNKLLQESLPSFSSEDLLQRARSQWQRENYRGLIETVRECQQFLPTMAKELAKQTRAYLDFYLGAAYVGLDRSKDALPHLRAANHTMRELLHVYGEEMWACCLLYLGQALAGSEPGNAERYLREAHDALLVLGEQQRAADKSDRDTIYYTGMALLELARVKADAVVAGHTGALPELLGSQREAVGFLLPLRDADVDADLQFLYRRKANQALTMLEKSLDHIPPSAVDLLTAVASQCEIAFTDLMTDEKLASALVRTAVTACQRARQDQRAAAIARSGRARVIDPELHAWLDGIIEEYEHREGLETRLAMAKQAISEGFFNTAYPDLEAAAEHAAYLKDTAMQSQIQRLLADTRLRDPGLVEGYLEEFRPLLRDGNFEEAERQLSRLRTAQGNNLALAEFRNEINAAKTAIVEQHVQAMLAALEAGDLDGVEEQKAQAVALARQLPAEPSALVQARRTLVEGVVQEHLRQAAELVQAGDFQGADEAFLQARGTAGDVPALAEILEAAGEQLQADRGQVIEREQRRIAELIAAGQHAEANLRQAELLRRGVPLELPDEHEELLNEYQHARRRLIEAQEFVSQGRITEADGAYRDVLLNAAAATFRDEVQDEYDLLKKDWLRQHKKEAERLVIELKAALGQKVDFKAARAALEALEALLPGSYDAKAVKPNRHRYELLWALAQRHYCKKDLLFAGTPLYITAGLLVVDIVLCVFISRLGIGFLPLAVIGLGLLAGTYSAAQCAAVKSMHAYTDKYHPFSVAAAGFTIALIVFGLSFTKIGFPWAIGLGLGIGVFFLAEFLLRNAMPIRVPE
jgi:hypothetical protein